MTSVTPGLRCTSESRLPICVEAGTATVKGSLDARGNIQFNGFICTQVRAGEDIPQGAVLRVSSTADRQVIQTTAADDISVLGVAVEAASAGELVCMASGGEFQVLVTGAVTRGDFLSTSATMGVATSTGTGGQPGDFAISMVTDAGVGTRLIFARYKKAEVF